jgi:hypothetical protein
MDNKVEVKVEQLQRKAAVFFNDHKRVHITFETRKYWKRGYIKEFLGDRLILFDDVTKTSETIFFMDLRDIREWVEKWKR